MVERGRRAWIAAAAVLATTMVATGAATSESRHDRQQSSTVPPADAGPGAAVPARQDNPAKPPAPPGRPKVDRKTAVADARAAVKRHGRSVHAARGDSYTVRDVLIDGDGARHVRFDRTFRDLPVLGGDYVVHAGPDGDLRRVTVAQDRPVDVDTRPAVSAARAKKAATAAYPGTRAAGRPALVVDAIEGTPALAWQVAVAGSSPYRRIDVVVDATSGEVRRGVDTVHRAGEAGSGRGYHAGEVALTTTRRDDGLYVLADPERGGSETRDARQYYVPAWETSPPFTDADNAWGDGTLADRATLAVDVQYGLGQTWDYFLRTHGRRGTHDDGRGARAMVHYRQYEANALWDDECLCMMFGDGDSTAEAFTPIDIVAHEFAHGVTLATADLVYAGEPGGLNEATSDIFGTLVEFAAQNPADPPDYVVGEKTSYGGDGLPLRYMDDPARDGDSDSCWSPETKAKDVHYSSGVANKFFYTLAEGTGPTAWGESTPCGDAGPVAGIGRDRAGEIWYRALTRYLVTNSNFADARRATLLAAADLHGADSAQYAAVDAAWRAVNVDGDDPIQQAPSVRNPGTQRHGVGATVSLHLRASDAQGDALTFAATRLPDGLTISAAGLISGTLTREGSYSPEVTASDPAGNTTRVTFDWEVTGPPVLTDPGPQTSVVGESVFFTLTASDVDSLTWTVTGLPDGLEQISPYAGYLFGTPTTLGTWQVTVTVTDADGLSASLTFPWTIATELPPSDVSYVTAYRDGTEATVSWGLPWERGETVVRYEVTTQPAHASATVEGRDNRTVVLTGLEPETEYTISVVAVNASGGRGPATTYVLPPADPAPEKSRGR